MSQPVPNLVQYRCSFCGMPPNLSVGLRIIAGPGAVYTCSNCVIKHRALLESDKMIKITTSTEHCSFCGKPENQVAMLYIQKSFGDVREHDSICNECLNLCEQLLDEAISGKLDYGK
jgi:hypothetical protein